MKSIIMLLLAACCITTKAQIYPTRHFKIYYSAGDNKNIRDIADSLEGNYTRIITDLRCQGALMVKIHLYANVPALWAGIKPWTPNPASWTTGVTLGDSLIHIVSPNAPKQDYKEMVKSVIHEFAHCVSRHINNKIANNPRWLWESIAIFESGQISDPRKLSYLVNQKPPTLKQLNNGADTTIYDVGYLISEYLVKTRGKYVLNALIKNNGNIKETLNMDDDEFTKQWFAFVKKEYSI